MSHPSLGLWTSNSFPSTPGEEQSQPHKEKASILAGRSKGASVSRKPDTRSVQSLFLPSSPKAPKRVGWTSPFTTAPPWKRKGRRVARHLSRCGRGQVSQTHPQNANHLLADRSPPCTSILAPHRHEIVQQGHTRPQRPQQSLRVLCQPALTFL